METYLRRHIPIFPRILWTLYGFYLSSCSGSSLSPPREGGSSTKFTVSSLSELSARDSDTRVGDGFDLVNGAYRETCLDAASTTIRTYPIKQNYDDIFVAASRSELVRQLQIEPSLEFSSKRQSGDFQNNAKFKILRENDVHSASFIAIAYSKYIRNEVVVYDSVPTLSPLAKDLVLKGNQAAFRRRCGDKYVKSAETGASLYLVFRAERVNETYHSRNEVENTLKYALGSLWGIGGTLRLTNDQKQILSNYRISSKCYSEGTSAHPCSDNMLNSLSISVTDEINKNILDRIAAAKTALSVDIDSSSNFVVLGNKFSSYDVPEELGSQDVYDVYFDYRPWFLKMQQWVVAKEQVDLICRTTAFESAQCAETQALISSQIDTCSMPHSSRGKGCRSPQEHELRAVYDFNQAGQITLFEHGGGKGRALTLIFDDVQGISEDEGGLRANTIYRLDDERFHNGFEDIISSFRSDQLKPGWQIILYEHPDGSGEREVITAGQVYGNVRFNDKASAFKLQRGPSW